MNNLWNRMAEILVSHSLRLGKGAVVKIKAPVLALPLAEAVYSKLLQVGAHPYYSAESEVLKAMQLRQGSNEQIQFIPPWEKMEFEQIDGMVSIWANTNSRFLSGVDPEKLVLEAQARREIFNLMLARMAANKFRWVGVGFPTAAAAQDADMSSEDYLDFFVRACFLDQDDPLEAWKAQSIFQKRLTTALNKCQNFEIIGQGTHLRLSAKGRTWVNCDGQENFPDGEVFTSPLEESAEGEISFSFPACFRGKEVEGVQLRFEKGKVVSATARKNQDYLERMLAMDEGASRIGELAFGTNPGVDRFTKDILFDEKLCGTMHLALGASLPETGGINQSALHWDMVCDLRQHAEVYADGELIFQDGKFIL